MPPQDEAKPIDTTPRFFARVGRFLDRPLREKLHILSHRTVLLWLRTGAPAVKRLRPGFFFLVWNDAIMHDVLGGTFELSERTFVERFLRPGMVVLDIGAYYGLYSLLASVVVGRAGRVIAFEPSPFQRKRLRLHARLNRLKNLRVESIALGNAEGEQTFFSVPGAAAGYSGLRRPEIEAKVEPISVQVLTLDGYLREHSIQAVDFIKIDVEGGELDVFQGAVNLLGHENRPVILCELEDVRTQAWGHKARDTAAFIENFGYRWFRPVPGGNLAPCVSGADTSDRNFIAVPPERMGQVQNMIESGSQLK